MLMLRSELSTMHVTARPTMDPNSGYRHPIVPSMNPALRDRTSNDSIAFETVAESKAASRSIKPES
jgi:hypothetical protein